MEPMTIALAVGAALFGYFAAKKLRSPSNLPPGPPAVPIFGSSLWIQFPMRCWILKTPQLYGQVCTFVLDGRRICVLNSYEAVREAFLTHSSNFSGRQVNIFTTKVLGNSGLLAGDGPKWKQLRRFSLQALRDFGFGKSGSEETIAREAQELIAALESSNGQPTSTSVPFNKAVSNVICSLVFGSRVADEDPSFEEKLSLINKLTQTSAESRHPLLTITMAFQRFLSPELVLSMPFPKKMVGIFNSVFNFCQGQIDAKEAAYNTADEPRDYIEAFLAERHRLTDAPQDAKAHLSNKNLQVSISDLFVAGTDTTANSLRWIALHLALNPDLQERLASYVKDKLGDRPPVMAFIHEAQRYYTLVPTGVPHRTTADAELLGYFIPKDTVVFSNIQAVHSDPTNFPDPETFDPDRFIDSAGKFRPSERIIPFSIGKRSMELFLFAVSLVQAFRIGIPDSESNRLDEIRRYSGGVVHSPGPHELIFQRRDDD
uniref:Cytochrome P450 n=1 Tax=Macrostomum lignano TaxID=282301 RepID=A0A1I8GZK7_9PLAT